MLRGVAIIAVVWIHARSGVEYAGTVDVWNFHYWVVGRQGLNFAVALFLFISGYLVNPVTATRRGWMRHRAVRLLIPFAMWSTIYFVVSAFREGGIGNPLSAVLRIVLGLSAWQLYFIVVLAQLVILTPLLLRWVRGRWAWLLFAITPVSLAVRYLYTLATGETPERFEYIFAAWFVFYFAGIWMRGRSSVRVGPAVAMVVAGFVASVVEAYVILGAGWPSAFAVSQLKFSTMLYSLAVIFLALALKDRVAARPQWLVGLGERSYGVYYVHLLFVILFALFVDAVPWLRLALPAEHAVEVPVVILLSLGSIWLVRRIIGERAAERFLGF